MPLCGDIVEDIINNNFIRKVRKKKKEKTWGSYASRAPSSWFLIPSLLVGAAVVEPVVVVVSLSSLWLVVADVDVDVDVVFGQQSHVKAYAQLDIKAV